MEDGPLYSPGYAGRPGVLPEALWNEEDWRYCPDGIANSGYKPCGSPIIRPLSTSRCDTLITMMKAAEFRDFDDHAMPHDLTLNRALFVQRQMRTRSVVQ